MTEPLSKLAAILILESMPAQRSALQTLLMDIGCPIVCRALSTREAAEHLDGVRFDAAFIDLDPHPDRALAFIQGIRIGLYNDDRSLPVIGVASAPSAVLATGVREAGGQGLLARPFSRHTVCLQLQRARQHRLGDSGVRHRAAEPPEDTILVG
jgi:DNA-binding NtrC family response regulator